MFSVHELNNDQRNCDNQRYLYCNRVEKIWNDLPNSAVRVLISKNLKR